ncbi:MAG: CBS domain-containing protein, partial [Desulfobacteraceae bacterium]|nr:CBS domain-containing protein [Desulfobacteraceae bacterium]
YRVAYDHALHRLKHAITAEQIMTRQVVTVPETAPLAEVVRLLADHDISGMPVVHPDRSIAGVISEKDFLTKMGGGSFPSFMHVILQCLEKTGCIAADIKKLTAKDIMSSPAVTIPGTTPLFEVADIMDRRNINRIPVMDEAGRLAGIVARSDLIQTMC